MPVQAASPLCVAPGEAIAARMEPGSHLDDLNPAQRTAATFGVPDAAPLLPGPPLLIIAGAGTGKTNTLAHRVAHLSSKGADPAASCC